MELVQVERARNRMVDLVGNGMQAYAQVDYLKDSRLCGEVRASIVSRILALLDEEYGECDLPEAA